MDPSEKFGGNRDYILKYKLKGGKIEKAFFENDKNLFYFTYYEGNKKSYLFYLFQALFKLQKGFYQELQIFDQFPLYLTYPKSILWFYDFISPFFRFIKSEFSLTCKSIDDSITPSKITLSSNMTNYILKKKINSRDYQILIDASGIASIETACKTRKIIFTR